MSFRVKKCNRCWPMWKEIMNGRVKISRTIAAITLIVFSRGLRIKKKMMPFDYRMPRYSNYFVNTKIMNMNFCITKKKNP